ncbi:ran-binding protein 3 isoform X4 [Ahaetulla prasina]|uniref:ran-binding protein 3 isoform X4 n=1 Tax=Ahaetulla prasina TaxID=499056 RepID=UPI00264A4913|nr:ran-binding protein 3 isoform X4 [Ahaetulla prasina]
MADLANEEKPAIAPPVFVFQKDKAQKSLAEQKGLSDSGEDPQGEAESPHRAMGHPKSTRGATLRLLPPQLLVSELLPVLAGDQQMSQVQKMGKTFPTESDREDGGYCPPVKRERTSSLTQFPSSQTEEKSSGFRLKPPTLIHGQAPSAGVPSQKPKEQQRSVLRPAVLQAPQPKAFSQTVPSSGTNGVSIPPDPLAATFEPTANTVPKSPDSDEMENPCQKNKPNNASHTEKCEKEQNTQQSFVFGQNLRDRVKLGDEGDESADVQNTWLPSSEMPSATNYFLQYISSSIENSTHSADASSNKFVFGQNMSERVLSPPKSNEVSTDSNKENTTGDSGSESSSQEATPEKANNISESLAESAAAYTKATARKCLLEKVEVITGEEAESNVLQIQCKLFVFDKSSQSWVERGRGLLRLNDMASTDDGTLQSRLVMRTQGSLRLILNTKLWAQMQIDKASEKSIRITAMDTEDQGVKVFLILPLKPPFEKLGGATFGV